MVFQSFNLFQHLTAAENVALPLLRVARADRHEAVARSVELLARVGLADKPSNCRPGCPAGSSSASR